jgi:nitrite reductase/ring-hydroxylating ferredoxin subunit
VAADGRICDSGALVEGGAAVRFTVRRAQQPLPAFVVRYRGVVHAYVNRCAHRGVELDWEPGKVFDAEGRYLLCATHGAMYEPENGKCIAGPCRGGMLVNVPVSETDGTICLASNEGWTLA